PAAEGTGVASDPLGRTPRRAAGFIPAVWIQPAGINPAARLVWVSSGGDRSGETLPSALPPGGGCADRPPRHRRRGGVRPVAVGLELGLPPTQGGLEQGGRA